MLTLYIYIYIYRSNDLSTYLPTQDIAETYRFICGNYRPEDELILLGFSRGAFTARSIAGMVCGLGFLSRAGIDQLPHIFRDYRHWSSWKNEKQFDDEIHLRAFTIENLELKDRADVLWEKIKAKSKECDSTPQEEEPGNHSKPSPSDPGPSTSATPLQDGIIISSASLSLATPKTEDELMNQLKQDKKDLFREIVALNKSDDEGKAAQVAARYRAMLHKASHEAPLKHIYSLLMRDWRLTSKTSTVSIIDHVKARYVT